MSKGKKGLVVTTGPTIRPITREEVKDHLRIDATNTSEDPFIDTIILAATEYFQSRSWRQLMTATYTQYLDEFPATGLELDKPPLQSITSIKYDDLNDAEQTLATSVYETDTFSQIGRVQLQEGESFPSTFDKLNAVRIEYKAGYGDARADVPDLIKSVIKLVVAHFYENRDFVQRMGNVSQIPMPQGIEFLINQHSIRSFV